jgi:MFS family permease
VTTVGIPEDSTLVALNAPLTIPFTLPRARPGSWKLIAPAIAMAAWGGNHFTPLLLLYRQVEGYTAVEVNLLLAFYIVGLVPGFLLAGPLSDRYGRKKPMFVGLAVGAAASVVLGLDATSLPLLSVGRLLSGVSVAIAMVVGSSWIKELSAAPYDPAAKPTSGARRSSLTLTVGLGLGAGVSGILAQWGPLPTLLPYALQILLTVVAAVALRGAPETRQLDRNVKSLFADLRVPAASLRRFFGVVVPMAPWVFSVTALAYAVMPDLVASHVGPNRIAFATLLTVVTLGAGAGIQILVPQLTAITGGRQGLVGLGLGIIGIGLAAAEATLLSPVLAVFVAAVLGGSYGVLLVSGLSEVQRMAGPDDMAGITGIYYSLIYVGFVLPVVLAALATTFSYTTLLIAIAVIGVACLLLVARNLGRVAGD